MRVAAAAGVAQALAELSGLPQGYWATITAVLVVQTSIGGALQVSRDRLVGTLAGALVGAAAVLLAPATALGEGLAIVLSVGLLAIGAAKYPILKVAPVTAIILILGGGGQHAGPAYAAWRVVEIMLGSLIGVAATLLVFPARARAGAIRRAGVIMDQLDRLFGIYALAVAEGETPHDTADLNAQVRSSLAALETVVGEAEREEQAHLGAARLPEALPRTLWRVRNDAVVIGRSLSRAFAPPIAERLDAPAAELLQAAQTHLRACSTALAAGATVAPSPVPAALTAFHLAFQGLRDAGVMRGQEFEEIGHAFGLAWGFDGLARNLADLADRVDETASGRAAASRPGVGR